MQHSSHTLQCERSTESSNRNTWSFGGLIGYLAALLALPLMVAEPAFAGGTLFGAVMLTFLERTGGG
ncbi:hypothetical protein AArcCO_0648 [Halalkaliarchaeum sp. AArc-CO]|uniref:hypothetical protein n=1 Tax=unclassified Halalkaliarchaeum TaxID=2678344 RepID=UPI00217EB79D|nr:MULTISPECIES: hypothetical protein [unclassified Halalkaliarchaeum]MDR5672400.1 hypothetical protein [Halalkaliarchaeum sp. AArc-GB]UWG49970.1 hypothetical protein AArcCO_0648 [Halalkaliarchaeum sp. AArc-CO]